MSTLLYRLLPSRVIRAIRITRNNARCYKLALRERPRVYGKHIDPL